MMTVGELIDKNQNVPTIFIRDLTRVFNTAIFERELGIECFDPKKIQKQRSLKCKRITVIVCYNGEIQIDAEIEGS